MTTTHILDVVFAILIVAALAGACRAAFLAAGQMPSELDASAGRDERLAA
jgi:hypothetical protein